MLGEMSILLTEGRHSQTKRLIELGFRYRFGKLDEAMEDLFVHKTSVMSGS
jgi:NAD dependent epimerase/dehydratase family enzyme